MFTYQVPRATFVPASITSLGRTTVVRTLSYLVLESPATDVVEFHCSFRNDSHARTCSGNLPRTSSFDLNSVTVELITTNMTFEVHMQTAPFALLEHLEHCSRTVCNGVLALRLGYFSAKGLARN